MLVTHCLWVLEVGDVELIGNSGSLQGQPSEGSRDEPGAAKHSEAGG